MEVCGGDDVSYRIPIATTINFDGVQYESVFATTNSVITFGQPDNTYWNYPMTPSISLYSMDWVVYPQWRSDEGMTIYYSEGGFQVEINARPIWLQQTSQPTTIVITAAITNEGQVAISYSTLGPTYEGSTRTGARLTNGQIVSLEDAGYFYVDNPEDMSLPESPVDPDTYVPGQETPSGPTEEEIRIIEEARVINLLISAAVGAQNIINPDTETEPITPEPDTETEPETDTETTDPETETEPETTEPELPEPDVVVDPEIITPEDPRFPEDTDEQNEQDQTTQPEDSDTEVGPKDPEEPATEPESPEEDEDLDPISPQEPSLPENPDTSNNNSMANLIADLASKDSFLKMTEEQKEAVSEKLGLIGNDIEIIQEQIANNEFLAEAVAEFAERLESNQTEVLPYTLADVTTEIQAEAFLEDPLGAVLNVDLGELLSDFGQIGMDMTDDQREKAQEVIVPVIIASQIVSAFTRRIG